MRVDSFSITSYIVILLGLSSCGAPLSYINISPSSSLLEQKGDLNVKVNVGSDFKFEDKTIDLAAAWSPVENWGIVVKQTKLVRSKSNHSFYSKFRNRSIQLVRYQTLNSNLSLEFSAGYGAGKVMWSETFSSTSSDVFPPAGFAKNQDQYKVNSNFNKLMLQSNINYQERNNARIRYTLGLRLQRMNFFEYSFISRKFGIYDQTFAAISLDPWIETNGYYGRIGWNTRMAYSFVSNDNQFGRIKQPHYRRLAITAGVFFTLKKKGSK